MKENTSEFHRQLRRHMQTDGTLQLLNDTENFHILLKGLCQSHPLEAWELCNLMKKEVAYTYDTYCIIVTGLNVNEYPFKAKAVLDDMCTLKWKPSSHIYCDWIKSLARNQNQSLACWYFTAMLGKQIFPTSEFLEELLTEIDRSICLDKDQAKANLRHAFTEWDNARLTRFQ